MEILSNKVLKSSINDKENYIDVTKLVSFAYPENNGAVCVGFWLKDRSSYEFLYRWEVQNNPDFLENVDEEMEDMLDELDLKSWINITSAKGVFIKGKSILMHIDLALRFAEYMKIEISFSIVKKEES